MELLDVLFGYAVSITSLLSLCATFFIVSKNIKKKQIFEYFLWFALLGVFVLSVISFFFVYPLPYFLVIIVVVFTIIHYLLKACRFISYPLLNVLLLFGMEAAKAPGNTWGLGGLPFGVLLIIFVLLLKLLDHLLYRHYSYKGILDIITGCISFVLIITFGFTSNEWTHWLQISTRKGLIVLSAVLIIEGVIMFYKEHKK